MRIVSLASGSGGNATCVECEDEVLLIDCGISCRELKKRCLAVGIDPARITSVLFTHNHIDHVKGAKVFHQKYPDALLYANLMTSEAIATQCGIDEFMFVPFENGQPFALGKFVVSPFSIPHDVPDPVGYLICAEGKTYFHATDVGTPLDSIGAHLAEADVALLESNHDPVLLRTSQRPESLKRRISGPRGHLANHESADLVRRFASSKLKSLALAHLSDECNAPHLAEGVMRETLAEIGRTDIALSVLKQDTPMEIYNA